MQKPLQLILAILTVLFGGAFWLLVGGATTSTFGLLPLYAVVDLVLFLASLGLSFIFIEPRAVSFLVFLGALPILASLESILLALGIILALSLLTLPLASKVRREVGERVDFSVWDILRKGLPTFLTLFALTLAAFFYPRGEITKFEDIIPKFLFEKTITAAERVVPAGSFLPFEIPDPKKTVDQVLIEAIRLEARDTWDRMPEEERQKILEDARRELARNLGVSSVEGEAEIGGVLYKGSIALLEERFGAYRRYLPAVFALAVFAAFRTLFIFLGLLSIALVWIIIKILLYLDMLTISERQVSQEYIELK